jgi:hypothetical protein
VRSTTVPRLNGSTELARSTMFWQRFLWPENFYDFYFFFFFFSPFSDGLPRVNTRVFFSALFRRAAQG